MWTRKYVRQECPLNPILFNIMIADLKSELGKEGVGGVKVGEERMTVLGYADDLVILAEKEGEMRCMMRALEKYLDRKGLILNTDKTKVIGFRRGGKRSRKRKW